MSCVHIDAVERGHLKRPRIFACEACVLTGSRWVHLRTCQTCGTTLCCDSSPNKHASKHAHAVGHPVVQSAEPGETWLYCFVDEELADTGGREALP